jgi:hypothetical protein
MARGGRPCPAASLSGRRASFEAVASAEHPETRILDHRLAPERTPIAARGCRDYETREAVGEAVAGALPRRPISVVGSVRRCVDPRKLEGNTRAPTVDPDVPLIRSPGFEDETCAPFVPRRPRPASSLPAKETTPRQGAPGETEKARDVRAFSTC